jgi:hypothetical protein
MAKEKSNSKAPKQKYLAGGNPQVAKANGDAPVQKYIAALSGWKKDSCIRLDAIITRELPQARKAVRWNSPFYGTEERGWFVAFHVFTSFVKLTFFQGTALKPIPTGGTAKEARWINIYEGELDEARVRKWVKQAAKLSGWGKC